jgi:hypothetical protein
MKLWEVVSNSKSMDGIDFQKNLSRGSLNFWEGDLVKAWMGLIFRKICQGDHFFGRVII